MAAPTYLGGSVIEYLTDGGNVAVDVAANFVLAGILDELPSDDISALTLGGANAVKQFSQQNDSEWFFGFSCGSPPVGSQPVVATGENGFFSQWTASLGGVHPTTPIRSQACAVTVGLGETSLEVTLPTTTTDDLIVAFVRLWTPAITGTMTPRAGATTQLTVNADRDWFIVTKPGASGTTTIGIDWTLGDPNGRSILYAAAISGGLLVRYVIEWG